LRIGKAFELEHVGEFERPFACGGGRVGHAQNAGENEQDEEQLHGPSFSKTGLSFPAATRAL
jgi:hypothetical protein